MKDRFIDNPYLILATRFVYNYSYYQGISVTFFFNKTVLSNITKDPWRIVTIYNLQLLY